MSFLDEIFDLTDVVYFICLTQGGRACSSAPALSPFRSDNKYKLHMNNA